MAKAKLEYRVTVELPEYAADYMDHVLAHGGLQTAVMKIAQQMSSIRGVSFDLPLSTTIEVRGVETPVG